MIRFIVRATFWVSLFVYVLPGIVEGNGNAAANQTADFSVERFCEQSPALCEEGRKAGDALETFAAKTALQSATHLLPAIAANQ